VGRAAAVLGRHGAAQLGLAGLLGVYYGVAGDLWNASVWWDVAWLALVLFPTVFALVYFALPARRGRELQLLVLGIAFAAAAAVFQSTGLIALASFAKLGATTVLAFLFLNYFESAAWVAIVACIVPLVDIYSVFWGPTSHIIKHPGGVAALSFAFRIPGESSYASLGLPDLLFFALFLGAAARFGLRPGLTWFLMVVSFGLTIVLAVWLDLQGLPALPGLSLGFFLANGDLLWARYGPRRRLHPNPE
jgi:hypothetical protein